MKTVDYNNFWYLENNPLSRTGVFPYLGSQISPLFEPERIYMVLRSETEIGSQEALESLRLLPVIEDHVMLGNGFGMVSPDDKGVYGVIGAKVFIEDGIVKGDIKIFSEHLQDTIENGKKEISMGYFCEYDLTPGIYNGQRYDAVQKNLRGNHAAIVDHGRMGSEICIMDDNNDLNSVTLIPDNTLVYSLNMLCRDPKKDAAYEEYIK